MAPHLFISPKPHKSGHANHFYHKVGHEDTRVYHIQRHIMSINDVANWKNGNGEWNRT